MSDILQEKGTVVCRLSNKDGWGLFHSPEKILEARNIEETKDAISKLEAQLAQGKYAAGFISYEAAGAFDKAALTKDVDNFPLAWFGIYSAPPESFEFPMEAKDSYPVTMLPDIKENDYLETVGRIKDYIFEGDIYQANLTFRLRGKEIPSPSGLFISMQNSHPAPYSAFVNAGEFQIASNSPELFLEIKDGYIKTRPMKGTESRKENPVKDQEAKEHLEKDSKNRAENLMILDMSRNDLGRICQFGSIKADPIFHVETYQSVHQMISEAKGLLKENTSLNQILEATFPAASITGAPKLRAMEIINEQEISSRKVYTGTIGCFSPDGAAMLNVAIRTLICFNNKTELGIGSGIVADSDPEAEWRESLLKSRFALKAYNDFKTLETMLWTKGDGIAFLKEHFERAVRTQKNFGRATDLKEAKKKLEEFQAPENADAARLRLLISSEGKAELQAFPLKNTGWNRDMLTIMISEKKTDSGNPFLYNKTTNRSLYDAEFKKAASNDCDEIIFTNEKGELTEGAISNIFIWKSGKWLTPANECGLLPGIWREYMIRELHAEEAIISIKDLIEAEKVIMGNSVRGKGVVGQIIKS
jgi:para-aminobenzoate synthetase/4-amino-4-deoxychorismate lyase